MDKCFVTNKVTNEQVYAKLLAIENLLNNHLIVSERRAGLMKFNIGFLWASVTGLGAGIWWIIQVLLQK